MKEKIFVLMIVAAPLCLAAQGVTSHSRDLMSLPSYAADAVFEVLLPQAEEPVTYHVSLQSQAPAEGDTLAPCRYLIRWTTETPGGETSGFSAYSDGHHYRYRGNRLQEYHVESNPSTFRPLGEGSESRGVQCTAQFTDLLPQFIGERMMQIATDSSYIYRFTTDTIVARRSAIVLEGVKRNAGYDVMEFCYVFDKDTGLPRHTEITNSPGSISEQIVSVSYMPASADEMEISEDALMEAYPEVFERFRQSTFRAENLPGSPLPPFACRAVGATERYQHNSDEGLAALTVIVALDPSVATASETVSAVRSAVASLPLQADVIWAFTTNRESDVTELLGTIRSGETALISAGALIRACGITLYPTTVIVGRDAVVKYVLPGFNKDYEETVIQKCML